MMVNDMKRRVAKVTKRRLTIFGTLSLIIIIYFSVNLVYHIYTIYDLKKQKNQLEIKYEELVKEAEDLQIEINKLNNSDYLARYAREKFSYSKEGEYIIKLNETKSTIDAVEDSLNTNYVVLGLSGVIFIIFVYIIIKSKRK